MHPAAPLPLPLPPPATRAAIGAAAAAPPHDLEALAGLLAGFTGTRPSLTAVAALLSAEPGLAPRLFERIVPSVLRHAAALPVEGAPSLLVTAQPGRVVLTRQVAASLIERLRLRRDLALEGVSAVRDAAGAGNRPAARRVGQAPNHATRRLQPARLDLTRSARQGLAMAERGSFRPEFVRSARRQSGGGNRPGSARGGLCRRGARLRRWCRGPGARGPRVSALSSGVQVRRRVVGQRQSRRALVALAALERRPALARRSLAARRCDDARTLGGADAAELHDAARTAPLVGSRRRVAAEPGRRDAVGRRLRALAERPGGDPLPPKLRRRGRRRSGIFQGLVRQQRARAVARRRPRRRSFGGAVWLSGVPALHRYVGGAFSRVALPPEADLAVYAAGLKADLEGRLWASTTRRDDYSSDVFTTGPVPEALRCEDVVPE